MAKKILWVGMLVMVLAFGIMFVGCDNGSTDDRDGGGSGSFGENVDMTYTGVLGDGEEIIFEYLAVGSMRGNLEETLLTTIMEGSPEVKVTADGKLTLNLGEVKSEYLEPIMGRNYLLVGGFSTTGRDTEGIELTWEKETDNEWGFAQFWYVDSDMSVRVQGGILNLKRGWNTVVTTGIGADDNTVTGKVGMPDASYKWIISDVD